VTYVRFFEWSRANLLRILNPAKNMVLPIYREQLLGSLLALFLGNDFIPYKAKNLGVTFNYDLSWGDHVSNVLRKVYGALAGLRRLAES
jgi:hypothetical protein